MRYHKGIVGSICAISDCMGVTHDVGNNSSAISKTFLQTVEFCGGEKGSQNNITDNALSVKFQDLQING